MNNTNEWSVIVFTSSISPLFVLNKWMEHEQANRSVLCQEPWKVNAEKEQLLNSLSYLQSSYRTA